MYRFNGVDVRIGLRLILLVGLGACGTQDLQIGAGESYTITSYSDPAIEKVLSRMSGERVLYVFDIDSTLLEYPKTQFVGSDHWYQWQSDLPKDSPQKIYCLLEMQAIANHLQPMIATEDGLSASLVGAIQGGGHDVIALTARGYDVRFATERELLRNGFNFSESAPAGHSGITGTYSPAENHEIPHPRDASFQNGVGMVAGQHKGAMLGDLISRLAAENLYDYIVFFDDGEENVKAVTDWFANHRITSLTFHYQGDATRFPGHELEQTQAETKALLSVFEVFGAETRCVSAGHY